MLVKKGFFMSKGESSPSMTWDVVSMGRSAWAVRSEYETEVGEERL